MNQFIMKKKSENKVWVFNPEQMKIVIDQLSTIDNPQDIIIEMAGE